MFGILGTFVSLGAVALRTMLDSSVLSSADLDEIGLPVLAVVPRSKAVAATHRATGKSGRKRATQVPAISPIPGMKAIPPASGQT